MTVTSSLLKTRGFRDELGLSPRLYPPGPGLPRPLQGETAPAEHVIDLDVAPLQHEHAEVAAVRDAAHHLLGSSGENVTAPVPELFPEDGLVYFRLLPDPLAKDCLPVSTRQANGHCADPEGQSQLLLLSFV